MGNIKQTAGIREVLIFQNNECNICNTCLEETKGEHLCMECPEVISEKTCKETGGMCKDCEQTFHKM